MHFQYITFMYSILSAFSLESTSVSHSLNANINIAWQHTPIYEVKSGATDIIFQSKDGGQTWEDISYTLPTDEQPEEFFAGESELYLRVNNTMYRSKAKLKNPVWIKDNLDARNTSIAFNYSGVMAFNYDGAVFQKALADGNWLPVYNIFKKQAMRTIFETSDGVLFVGSDNGLYKSIDKGQHWKQVAAGWFMEFVESENVLLATSQTGIMRSTDNGEHWEAVISEGGVGIAIERINGGFAAISYNTTLQTRKIHLSLDSGKTWSAIDEGLKPSSLISSIKQVGDYLLCGHPDGIFRSADKGKTWKLVHPGADYALNMFTKTSNGKVFKIYVSGNTVYALARNGGC